MKPPLHCTLALVIASLACARNGMAQEVPAGANLPPIPITSHDRVYHADQRSNTISVYDPSSNTLLGVIQLGEVPQSVQHPPWVDGEMTPANISPLYYGQLLVHGMGFSFDHRTLDVVSVGLQLGDVH